VTWTNIFHFGEKAFISWRVVSTATFADDDEFWVTEIALPEAKMAWYWT
jgi:hypothetical protein